MWECKGQGVNAERYCWVPMLIVHNTCKQQNAVKTVYHIIRETASLQAAKAFADRRQYEKEIPDCSWLGWSDIIWVISRDTRQGASNTRKDLHASQAVTALAGLVNPDLAGRSIWLTPIALSQHLAKQSLLLLQAAQAETCHPRQLMHCNMLQCNCCQTARLRQSDCIVAQVMRALPYPPVP